MILHTIVSSEFLLQSIAENAPAEAEYYPISHGYAEVRRQGSSLITGRILSTDLRCYLSPDYAPGAVWKKREK